MPQSLSNVAFAGTAGADDENGHFFLDKAAGSQVKNLRPVYALAGGNWILA